jgi:hypothetical protein
MPSMDRRTFLAGASATLLAASGCTAPASSLRPAHWVTVYLGERDETHEVTVAVENDAGDVLFEETYRLSDDDEADEDAPFPATADPDTVVVTVDGARFERDWPGFENPQLPCDDANQAGIELWVESGEDGRPSVRMEADCQHVTME